jgi:16S rRNA (guanine966-N2)-methyltransferase
VAAVRVIGGRSRGRRLAAKLPTAVRPTSDRVRESIFDILGSRGGVEGLSVLDLFCGSGALGLEALSRGAAAATFVDQDPGALEAVRTNLDAVGLGDEPPYTFEGWPELLSMLRAETGVLESAVPIELPGDWVVARERRYGGTLITVAHHNENHSENPSGPSS